jgi:preprotein translocase subunit SecY
MERAINAIRRIWSAHDLRNRILWTLGLVLIYQLCTHIPVPGADLTVVQTVKNSGNGSGGLLGVLNFLSGGSLARFSVLAMGVQPYITAQIILQLLTPIIPALQRKVEDDPREGRKFIERWTMYLSIPMGLLAAYGQIQLFQQVATSNNLGTILPNFGFAGANLLPTVATLLAMTAGTMFAIWLGELISENGIRNQGLSLIIFAGIVNDLPGRIVQMWTDQSLRYILIALFLILLVVAIYAVIYVTQGRRNIVVMYPGRRMGFRQSMPVKGTLPLMVNMAGMIPIIFSSALLSFPAIIGSWFLNQGNALSSFGQLLVDTFSKSSSWSYMVITFIMVVAFTYFYTSVLFDQQNQGEQLKRVGARVPGVTPGPATQRYLSRVQSRITLPGALLLGIIAVLPMLVGKLIEVFSGAPSNASSAFLSLGSGLIIVVGVVRDTFLSFDTELKLRGYDESLLVR